jgi:hypothetical protein
VFIKISQTQNKLKKYFEYQKSNMTGRMSSLHHVDFLNLWVFPAIVGEGANDLAVFRDLGQSLKVKNYQES